MCQLIFFTNMNKTYGPYGSSESYSGSYEDKGLTIYKSPYYFGKILFDGSKICFSQSLFLSFKQEKTLQMTGQKL